MSHSEKFKAKPNFGTPLSVLSTELSINLGRLGASAIEITGEFRYVWGSFRWSVGVVGSAFP